MRLALVVIAVCWLFNAWVRAADFAIHDGDTVVFLGDSITAEGSYGKIIENYTLLRFPKHKVHFLNAGWGGDTAAGGLKRLQRDVFDQGATVLTVAYGINDIGWGAKADAEQRQKYLDSIRGIVEQCKAHHVRVFICSAAATATDPDKAENDFLKTMCDEGMAISRTSGEGAIDVQKTMHEIQRRIKQANGNEKDKSKHETLHAGDGIHLNDLGQLAMAFGILKGLDAPSLVSSAAVDASNGTLMDAEGCAISDLKITTTGLEFSRLDEGLPFNSGLFFGLKYRFIPLPEEINRYMLRVENLKASQYKIVVDGRALGNYPSDQLAKGINISSATADGWEPGGPWDAQAWSLTPVTDARFNLFSSGRILKTYDAGNPQLTGIADDRATINARLEELQRRIARPRTLHFVLTRIDDKK